MLKILYHHRIASKDGQYVHVSEILNSLDKMGVSVKIVSPKISEEQEFGGEVGFISQLKKHIPKSIYELMELSYSVLDFFKIVTALIRFKPDFIYERYNLYFPSGVIAAKLFGIPLILEINAPIFAERKKYNGLGLHRLAKWTETFVWRNADHVLPVTSVLADMVADEGVPESKITVIANGINDSVFMEHHSAQQLPNIQPGQVVVGFVGFCREWHQLDKIVQLIADDKTKKLYFVIVGDGPIIPEIKQQVKDLGCENRVHFSGLVERSDMPGWLETIEIALQPAVVDYASPLKLIEYLATGKAIVAPSQANIMELLEDGDNALLFAENDYEGLLDNIRRLANDDELRNKIALGAKQTIQKKGLLWDKNAERIVALGKTLVNVR